MLSKTYSTEGSHGLASKFGFKLIGQSLSENFLSSKTEHTEEFGSKLNMPKPSNKNLNIFARIKPKNKNFLKFLCVFVCRLFFFSAFLKKNSFSRLFNETRTPAQISVKD